MTIEHHLIDCNLYVHYKRLPLAPPLLYGIVLSLQFSFDFVFQSVRLSAGSSLKALFLKAQLLQLASASCQRVCRMLGCCKLEGDARIVMSLYPKSAAKLLEESQGSLIGIGLAPGIQVQTDCP